jgi:hypothetical protein
MTPPAFLARTIRRVALATLDGRPAFQGRHTDAEQMRRVALATPDTSTPQIPLVILDAMFHEERAKLLLKRPLTMMLPLPGDILDQIRQL